MSDSIERVCRLKQTVQDRLIDFRAKAEDHPDLSVFASMPTKHLLEHALLQWLADQEKRLERTAR